MGRRSAAETPARILALYRGRGEWDQVDLAERLGVTPRALRHAMASLRRAGIPVERVEYSGIEIGWRLPPITLGGRPFAHRVTRAQHEADLEARILVAMVRHEGAIEPAAATVGVGKQVVLRWLRRVDPDATRFPSWWVSRPRR